MTSVKSIYGDKEQASEVREVFGRHRGADVPGCPPSRFTIFSRPGRSPPPARSPQPLLPRLRRSQFWVQKYERDARKNWDIFYKNHQEKFFKDRHYLAREFPHIFPEGLAVGGGGGDSDADADDPDARADADDEAPARSSNVTQTSDGSSREVGPAPRYVRPPFDPTRPRVFLEVGCGAGNTSVPLLEVDPHAIVYCCDFSPRAVELVRKRRDALPPDQAARVHPSCATSPESRSLTTSPRGTVDVCTMVFVLSAVSPEKMSDALRNVSSTMRPNGERSRAASGLRRGGSRAGAFRRQRRTATLGKLLRSGARRERHPTQSPPARHVRHPRKRPALTPPILTILLVSNQGDGTRAFYFTPPGLRALFSARGWRWRSWTCTNAQSRIAVAVFGWIVDGSRRRSRPRRFPRSPSLLRHHRSSRSGWRGNARRTRDARGGGGEGGGGTRRAARASTGKRKTPPYARFERATAQIWNARC